ALDSVYGIRSDGPRRRGKLDTKEARGVRREGIHRDADAGQDRSTKIVPIVGDRVQGRRRAKIDYYGGSSVSTEGAHGVADPIGSYVGRRLIMNADSGVGLRPDDKGLAVKVSLCQFD